MCLLFSCSMRIYSAWSEDGCYIEQTNRTHTVCMCNHLTNFAILMDLVDDGAEILQQLSQFNENMKFMISISVAVCIIFIIIVIMTLKYFNGAFVKVSHHRRRRRQQSSSSNARDDIIIDTNPNNTNHQRSAVHTAHFNGGGGGGAAGHEFGVPQHQSTPLNVLRNINYAAQANVNRSNNGSIRGNNSSMINNNIFGTNHDRNNMNNRNVNNSNVVNCQNQSNSSNLTNNVGFVRDTEISLRMNGGVPDGMIVMRTTNGGLSSVVGDSASVQYHHHHLHHHLHHHHHYGTGGEMSSHSGHSSPSLDAQQPITSPNNACENINLRDFSV